MIGSILDTIYESEYFGLILMVAIIFLVILFLIVLFMGKKDKKQREVEATKKLEQINENAFKEESVAQDVTLPVTEPVLENMNVVNNVPKIEENEPVVDDNEVLEPVNMNSEVEMIDSIPTEPVFKTDISEPVIENADTVEPAIEEPIVSIPEVEPMPMDIPPVNVEINPINSYTTDEVKNNDIVKDEVVVNVPEINIPEVEIPRIDIPEFEDKSKEEEKSTPVLEPISVPDFNFDTIVEEASKVEEEPKVAAKPAPQIFSSVYVPKQEVKEDLVEPVIEEPTLKEVHEDSEEEEEFELPTLKKDTVNESEEEAVEEQVVPIFDDYDLDSLSGETYNINK